MLWDFLADIGTEDLILTANRRLAVYLNNQYDQFMSNKGICAWQRVLFLPLASWIESTWYSYSEDERIILNDDQELFLWEQIVSRSSQIEGLLNVTTTANLAKDTYKLLQQWCLNIESLKSSDSIDVQAYQEWQLLFQQHCLETGLLSRSDIIAELLSTMTHKGIFFNIPKRLFFVGFDELTPNVSKLISFLEKYIFIKTVDIYLSKSPKVERSSFQDQSQELHGMVNWALNQLKQNPQASIGCIIPNLGSTRTIIQTIFEEQLLYKDYQDFFAKKPYNLSAANSLAEYPLINTIIDILSLNTSEIEALNFFALITSPFIAGAETELSARIHTEMQLRLLQQYSFAIKNILKHPAFNSCPILSLNLQKISEFDSQIFEEHTLFEWAALFSEQLKTIGWPGERSLNSLEYQLVERFKKLLDQFSQINSDNTFSFEAAVRLLKQLIQRTEFQAQSESTPIQVLGVLESAGIQFDYLWIAGLDNSSWPPAPNPNPFIPMDIQRQLSMPHSSCEREFEFSCNVLQRLLQNSKEIILSYPEHKDDQCLLPSSLILPYPETTTSFNHTEIMAKIYESGLKETLEDNIGPPVAEDISLGGSGLFKSQAHCPFQSFAKFRLHAKPFDAIELGLNNAERGNIIHTILANLWKTVKNYHALSKLTDEEIKAKVTTTTKHVLKNYFDQYQLAFTNRFQEIETKRLSLLITQWLLMEKDRQPFEVIACEQRQEATINKLTFTIQIDRIDQLDDGSHVIIDYKTGNCSVFDWFQQSPSEPQLPLYTTLAPYSISAVLFGQVHKNKHTFKGVSKYNAIAPGSKTLSDYRHTQIQDWEQMISFWKNSLDKLANDFIAGIATVAPKEPSVCQFCQLQILCRVRNQVNTLIPAMENELND